MQGGVRITLTSMAKGLPLATAIWRLDYMEEDLDLWSWGNLTAAEMETLAAVAPPPRPPPAQPAYSSEAPFKADDDALLQPAQHAAPAKAGAASSGAERTTVPFQYAWRFHYGDDPSSPPGSGPGIASHGL